MEAIAVTDFTAADKLRAVERELRMRRRVYPRWVEAGKMKLDHADREILLMEAIKADYAKAVAHDLEVWRLL
jgi:hypothetical protein